MFSFQPDPGATLAAYSRMFNFGAANLIAGFIFGSVGFVAFMYGKRMSQLKIMLAGLALMIFPYFVSNTAGLYVIGTLVSASLFFLRN
jgi:hypothetical protein